MTKTMKNQRVEEFSQGVLAASMSIRGEVRRMRAANM